MSNRRTTMLAALCAAAGLVVGSLAAGWLTTRFLCPSVAGSSVAALIPDGSAVQKMHAGDIIGATRLLQARLDEELMSVGAAVKQGFKLTPEARTAIAQIKRLRDSTGYTPADPATRKMVDDALALGSADPGTFN